MGAGVPFPAALVVCAVLAAAFLVGITSASWHAQVFIVGGEPRGWAKPAAPTDETYNHWAARNRFHVGDFLHFKYDKNDSVLVVSRDDYKFCSAARPARRFGGGDTRLRLDNSGFTYFISGAPGHCDEGQRMTLRVLPQHQDSGGSSKPGPAGAPGAMSPGGGGDDEEEGGGFAPPYGSGPESTTTPPPHPHAVVGGADRNKTTSSAAPARASFGGCCHRAVGAVAMGASLLVLGA